MDSLFTRYTERDTVPQAPVEAVGFRAERPDHESSDAEPSPSQPGGRPGAPWRGMR